jgi:excisionase family DNA binding protein
MDEPMTAAEWDALPPVLTPEQVARIFGVTRARVVIWAGAGTLPATRIGKQWRFSKSALAAMGQHERGPGSGDSPDGPGSS